MEAVPKEYHPRILSATGKNTRETKARVEAAWPDVPIKKEILAILEECLRANARVEEVSYDQKKDRFRIEVEELPEEVAIEWEALGAVDSEEEDEKDEKDEEDEDESMSFE